MRIVVTGGAGFIGSHIADKFLADGHRVMVLDDMSGGKIENVPTGAQLVQADVRSAPAYDALRAFAPEVVCHHAAQMDVRKSVADPALDASINLVGLCNVMEGARLGGALSHVLFASSGGAMYGEQDSFPASEDHAVRPESPYGLAKAVSEQYLAWYHRMYRITYTALRYGNVYGPRQSPHGEAGVVAIFSDRILDQKPMTVFGDGLQTRDYVFVDDVVSANVLGLVKRLHGGFNVGTGVETNVLQLVDALAAASRKQPDVVMGPPRAGEQKRSVISAAKLQSHGWSTSCSVSEGFARTFRWFSNRRNKA
jgi:UDP-glucose 4-epimerase